MCRQKGTSLINNHSYLKKTKQQQKKAWVHIRKRTVACWAHRRRNQSSVGVGGGATVCVHWPALTRCQTRLAQKVCSTLDPRLLCLWSGSTCLVSDQIGDNLAVLATSPFATLRPPILYLVYIYTSFRSHPASEISSSCTIMICKTTAVDQDSQSAYRTKMIRVLQ